MKVFSPGVVVDQLGILNPHAGPNFLLSLIGQGSRERHYNLWLHLLNELTADFITVTERVGPFVESMSFVHRHYIWWKLRHHI